MVLKSCVGFSNRHENMYTLILLIAIISHTSSDPRSPKIYNVLISSKKNLAPSQALPVYEPVLRTTSLGYAYSPFVYTHFGTLPAATTYIQQPAINVHDVRQPSGTIYQTQASISENRYLQQETVPTLPKATRPNQLPPANQQRMQQPVLNINEVRTPNNPAYQTQPTISSDRYPEQRLEPTLQREEPPNQLSLGNQRRPDLYRQPAETNMNKVRQSTNSVYQIQQSLSENRYPQQGPASTLEEVRPQNQIPQSSPERANPYMETKTGVKSLPNNVVPLEYNVPYYAPLSYQQYLPRIETLHIQPQTVSIQSHPVPIQPQTVPIQPEPGLQPAGYGRPELVPPEQATYERRPPIPPQPLTYEKLFGDNQTTDPKQIIANFKRNPGIADVPPPPLPVKSS